MRGRILVVGLAGVPGLFASAASAVPCPVDLAEPYGVVNFFDLLKFMELFEREMPAADLAEPFGVFNYFDLLRFFEIYAIGCDTDSDGDRIPDWAETNDGVYLGPHATGTDPFNPDTDGDGIIDGDEIYGTVDGLDLPGMGANPLRKDIFVECDWFAGEFEGSVRNFRPRQAAVDRLVQAFANAPVANPYGLPSGISIHLDFGQGGAFTGGNQLPGQPVFITFPEEFQDYKAVDFNPNRLGYFHYAIFANRYNSADNRASGVGEIVGDDFMVTMVNYLSSYNQSQTIMHELGHNLGLRHGGFENRNNKPNYNSVMNYRHQFPGVDITGSTIGDGVLDYSWGINDPIDENAIVETNGVIGTPVDFNRDGVIQLAAYARNINCSGETLPCGESAGSSCWDSVCTELHDQNDWAQIAWHRLASVGLRDIAEVSECVNAPE